MKILLKVNSAVLKQYEVFECYFFPNRAADYSKTLSNISLYF